MDVSIIIVNYNTKTLTLDCLASIYKESKSITFEVILWDNASIDGSAEAFLGIEKLYPNFKLIVSEENHGFAKANNLAALKSQGDFLLLLNPDTKVLDHAVDKIVEHAKSSNQTGIFGGSTFYGNGERNTTSCWNMPSVWSMFTMGTGLASLFRESKLFNPESFAWWDWKSPREVDIVTGCLLLMKRSIWDHLKGFDLRFFMYGEDADLCTRARKAGYTCMIFPDVEIIHYEGSSEPNRSDKMIRLFKAKELLLDRHYPKITARYGKIMLDLYAFSRMVACSILSIYNSRYRQIAQTWKEVLIGRRGKIA